MYIYVIVLTVIVTEDLKTNRNIKCFRLKPMIVKGITKKYLDIFRLSYTLISGTISSIFLKGNLKFWQELIAKLSIFQIL